MLRTSFCRSAAGILLCVLAVALTWPAQAQSPGEERRVALVMGNVAYEHVPRLTNSGNDATLIATTLRRLGFTLVGGGAQDNVDKAHFDRLVQDFGLAIQGADVALFYYAGHGMQVDGGNWLVPTDANPTRPQDLEFQMVNAELVLKQMDGAGTRLNMVILDACRNNPFATLGTRAVQGGLAQMRAPEGTLISFATQPGNVAADGAGANGPFAAALAASVQQPGLDIFRVFNRVGLTVKRDTDGAQLPWVSSSPIDGEFYFTQTDAAPEPIAAAAIDAAPAVPPDQAGQPRAAPAAETPGTLQGKAEQGKADAQFDLGFAYATGKGVPKDDALARHWLGLAAAQGMAKAQFAMGVMLERGRGGARSYAEALQWYRRAADQGFAPAEVALGRFYGHGLGVSRDAEQRTDWYRRAADHGNPAGEWALGNFYQLGDGVDKDLALARQLYERAAGQGFVLAEVRLGLMSEHGVGTRQDYAEALRWFRRAAEAGNAVGLNALGTFYRRGLAVPKDYAQAMRLYRQAADKGNVTALLNIGILYADGLGVKVDKPQARAWFERAAAAGSQPASERLARIDAACNAGGRQRTPGQRAAQPAC
jgi:TPR repeat protein